MMPIVGMGYWKIPPPWVENFELQGESKNGSKIKNGFSCLFVDYMLM
jgi:hypothetical protein